ncbi:MAG: sigma-70 family RNA polymerase sigma factor [Pseudomonadota bacterium]
MAKPADRPALANWIGASVMPHEPKVRAWLGRAKVSPDDIDDLLQEAYCKLAGLDTFDHIERPDAYFFSLTRNLLLRKLRRSSVVPLTRIAEIEAFDDDRPSPEREAAARSDFDRVRELLSALPERSRRIIEKRKFDGLSQREIASSEGISEGMVEYHVYQGIKTVIRALKEQDEKMAQHLAEHEQKGHWR